MAMQDHENLPDTEVDDTQDEAVSLFAQIAEEKDSGKDSDSDADLNDEQLDQDEVNEQQDDGDGSQNEQDADPWKDLPPHLREQVNQLQRANQQLQQQYSAVTGRLAPTQRELENLKKQLAQQAQQQVNGKSTGPTADQIEAMSDDELEQEWPDIAAALRRREQQLLSRIEERLSPFEKQMQQQEQEQQQRAIENELGRLQQVHPDYQRIVQDSKFAQWLATQPHGVQQLAESMAADENIVLLNLYKSATGKAGNNSRSSRTSSLKDQVELPRKGTGRPIRDLDDADPAALFHQLASQRK